MLICVSRLDYGILLPETTIRARISQPHQWIHSAQTTVAGAIESRAERLRADVRSVSPSPNEQTSTHGTARLPMLRHLERCTCGHVSGTREQRNLHSVCC